MAISSVLVDKRSIFSFPPPTLTPSAHEVLSESIDWQKTEDISNVGKCPAEIHCTLPDGIKIGTRRYAKNESDHGLHATKFFEAHATVSKGTVQLVRREIGNYKWIVDADGAEQRVNTHAASAQGDDYKLIIDPDGTEYQMNMYKHLPHRTDSILVLTPLAGFINHSCDPNCFGIVTKGKNEHRIVALRDIQANEEITMDYCLSEYDMKGYIQECECQMPSCRGSCEGFRYLSDYEKQKLAPYANLYIQVQYLLEKKDGPAKFDRPKSTTSA